MAVRFWPLGGSLLAILISAGAIAPASATPPLPVHSWTGWYVGANAGSVSGHSNSSSLFTCPTPGACAYETPDLARISALATGPFSDRGTTAGIQVGYNWQIGVIVVGVEADINAMKLHQQRTVAGVPLGEAANNFWVSTGVTAIRLMTVRGRLGVTPVPTVLLYATGGTAVTDFTVANQFVDDAATIPGVNFNTFGRSVLQQKRSATALGGGAEWALARNWTIRAEYLYFNFGSTVTTARVIQATVAPDKPNYFPTTADFTARVLRFGFNYHFGP